MQISWQWLKELSDVDWTPQEMADRLTLSGLACEEIIPTHRYLDKVVVGEVLKLDAVEGASKIRKATVTTGAEQLSLICGAPNVAVGQKVPIAQIGATMANGMEIKKVTIRGVESSGMICSESELGISTDHSGIMVLDPSAQLGQPLAQALGFEDYILGFEITPNRGDALSAIGIARDLAALAGTRVTRPEIKIRETAETAANYIRVGIEDPLGCPRYAARVIKNITIGPSPWWLKKRLLTAGVRPISNVVDVTNYVMLESGNPLHAFDYDLLGSKEIVVRRARDKEPLTTLDGKSHSLTTDVLLITNGKEPVAVAGVMGGQSSEVNDHTTTVLLEAAYFDPVVIRKGRKKIGTISEASSRFERGVDPNNVPYAMDRACYLFQEVCGGQVQAGTVDEYPNRKEPKTIVLRPERCDAIMGVNVTIDKMKQILTSLELKVEGTSPLAVTVPTFRSDIATEIDLIEEVSRIIGWGNIPDATQNKGPLYTPAHPMDLFEREVRRILTGSGFDEILGHGLGDSRQAKLLYPDRPMVRIVNPVSDDLDIMRNGLLVTMLNVVSSNLAQRNIDLRLFELGSIYVPPTNGHDFDEPPYLSFAVTGNTPGNWRDKTRSLELADVIGAIENLARHFHWPQFDFALAETPFFETGGGFAIVMNGAPIGVAGKLNPELARKFDIKQPVFVAELSLSPLVDAGPRLVPFEPLPIYPPAPRDLAIVVDQTVMIGHLLATVKETAGPLAETVSVFDIYTGKQVGDGKKSVGISIVYRSKERSLSSDEVDAAQAKVIEAVRSRFNADIREK